MAERRMFAKTIVLSDAFLDLPMSARCLYFTLGMVADDDGFVNSPRAIMRQIGSSDDDMKVLVAKKFVIIFDSGIIVIKHWRINNYLRNDRYTGTKYVEEKEQLHINKNGGYTMREEEPSVPEIVAPSEPENLGIPNNGIPKAVSPDKVRLDKDSIDKVSIDQQRLLSTPPASLDEIKKFCSENGIPESDGEMFFNEWNKRGWRTSAGEPIQKWQSMLKWQHEHCAFPKTGAYAKNSASPYIDDSNVSAARALFESYQKGEF